MLGLFGTLNMASRALQTQMAGVEVAGQNLANVSTAGYSRQRVVIQANASLQTGIGSEGTGASATSIEQIVDKLLNNQIQSQTSVTSNWTALQSALQTAETDLGENLNSTSSTSAANGSSSSSNLSDQISSFFQALQGLAATPSSVSARQKVLGEAQNLATSFQQITARLTALTTDLNTSLTTQVASANQLLTDIAGLNDTIANAENSSPGIANDLRDLRQQKLEELSKFLNFQSATAADGSVTVTTLGTQTLVSGNQVANALKIAPDPITGKPQVWTVTNNNVLTGISYGLTGGSFAGTVNARDGAIATLQTSLNTQASNLITQVNAIHSAGYSLTDSTGANFFNGNDATNINVNPALASDPTLLQASSTAGPAKDNVIALALGQLASTALAGLGNQTFSDAYTQSVTQLGTALKNANDQVASQNTVASMLNTQRASVSGVNLDEEMTNLLAFQRAYQASAHVVSTVDQMIQTILAMKV